MEAGWEWDETLFSGTAAFYRRGRLPYAPGLADLLAGVLDLDGRGRLLDLGCGPGTVALPLAGHFDEVVGVDPDPGMLAEAVRGAAELDVADRVRWVRARAEELPAGLGDFTVATLAQSFHWMDREPVAATVRGMLRPGGALVHISDLKGETRAVDGLPHPPVPRAAIDGLVRGCLGPVRRAGRGLLPRGTPSGEDTVLAGAGFAGFEADLRRLLRDASPSGRFSARQPGTEVFVWLRGAD
ncbi:class I SAM-dependent methyltransferase [Streptomyces tendae]|uniref:class I SAM-dependent methyltransferase n=1 Tax=Streptomyces tendae TaxID=1932 RepID=UPI0036A780A3